MKTPIILLDGNMTFHHFEPEEEKLFKTNLENKAVIHEVYSVLVFKDKEKAYERAEESESYLLFPDFKGEAVFEEKEERERILKEIELLVGKDNIPKTLTST